MQKILFIGTKVIIACDCDFDYGQTIQDQERSKFQTSRSLSHCHTRQILTSDWALHSLQILATLDIVRWSICMKRVSVCRSLVPSYMNLNNPEVGRGKPCCSQISYSQEPIYSASSENQKQEGHAIPLFVS